MRTRSIAVFVVFCFLLISSVNSAEAAPKPGASCSKLGQTVTSAGKKYTCIKSGKKLVWNKGVVIAALPDFPSTSASAITSPPLDLKDINSQVSLYGTGADPNIITLGLKLGSHPDWKTYPGKTSMEFEIANGSPLLAPIDMVLIGFNNKDASSGIGADGTRFSPFNDLELCFQSKSAEWPGFIICFYHMLTSPLLLGQNVDPKCSQEPEWPGTFRGQGHLFYTYDDYIVTESPASRACQGLIGRSLKRGQLFGFAGSVGTHSMAPIRMKVPNKSVNKLVKKGDTHLHWVQPATFFYWKCYAPGVAFPKGVLAYPFECGNYQLPSAQHNVNFKYTAIK
jgi:hypothetical protein